MLFVSVAYLFPADLESVELKAKLRLSSGHENRNAHFWVSVLDCNVPLSSLPEMFSIGPMLQALKSTKVLSGQW